MTTKLFSELGISPEVLKGIDRLGFEQASPIQAETIPLLLEGVDVVGQSQTGSGKTAAFGIPAIERVDTQQRAVQVLVLCPTRELAVQVSEEIHKLAFFKRGIHALPIYGGQSYERQFYGLKQGAQIVIGTPGRVMDHMRRGTLRLDQLRMAILDEADVMLDMGFREDIEFILQAAPAERQTVFFSATMPRPIQELIRKHSRDPRNVQIEQKAMTVPTVEQVYYEVDRRFKVELLTRLIDLHDLKLGIIFCNTKRMVDDLVDHLNAQGYSADRLHGDMSQALRDRVMGKFRKSGLEFLVATDVAARGIDVNDVEVVFNYDLPYDVEDYVHRIGRTGRAGRNGLAISFVAGREVFQVRQIERFTRTRVHRAKIPTVNEVEQARAAVFLEKVRATLQGGEFQRQDHLLEILLEEGFSSTDIASALIHLLQEENGQAERPPASENSRPPREGREERQRREGVEPRERRPPTGDARRTRGAAAPPRTGTRAGEGASPDRAPEISSSVSGRLGKEEAAEGMPARTPSTELADGLERPSPEVEPAAVSKPPSKAVPPSKPLPAFATRKVASPAPAKPVKVSRRTPDGQTRLFVSAGSTDGMNREGMIRLIQGETGLSAAAIGEIDLRERHSFVDLDSNHANAAVSKLNRARFGARRLKVKVASRTDPNADD